MKPGKLPLFSAVLTFAIYASPQNVGSNLAASAAAAVPPLVPYSGVTNSQPAPTNASVTFLIYSEEQGGDPIFSETQSVAIDATGHFKTQIGATLTNGLPMDLFANGEARWLAVQIAGEPAQPRVLLASVPYALKAADAATLGGLPASAFALAGTKNAASAAVITPDVTAAAGAPITTTTGGFSGYLPVFTGPTTISNSTVYQNSSGIGINGIPYAALDVTGRTIFRGTMVVSRAGNATATTGYGSVPLQFFANGWNSTINGPVQPVMQWQAEPTGNNTASPGATLNLLYNSGTVANAVETGLYFNPNGTIHFAAGQTFPGAAGGNSTTINAASYDLGGALFAFGSASQGNAFLGFSGNSSTSSSSVYNTGAGDGALYSLSTGQSNSAFGSGSLSKNTTGNWNTAVGFYALDYNTSGSNNTAVGFEALEFGAAGSGNTAVGVQSGPIYSTSSLSNATAIGAYATVSQSNSLVLGQTTAGSPGNTHVNVGIGTAAPATTMEISVNAPSALGPTLTLTNPGGTTDPNFPATASIDFKTYLHSSTLDSPTSRIEAVDADYGNNLNFDVKVPGSDSNGLKTAMSIASAGVDVNGTLFADVKDFKIDHPADPANKYLLHTSVESSEMMNIYSGNVTTDELGLATVTLPDWFEAENGDFRYQLTTIGRDAHAWIAQEVSNHQFKVASNATFVKVSWQITAVRQDAYAMAHPLVVEQQKPAQERGFYRHPELYGQPQEKSVQWARHPKQLQRMKAIRDRQSLKDETATSR